jgi:hypothetical protein
MSGTVPPPGVCDIELRLHAGKTGGIPSWLSAVLQAGFGMYVPSGLSVNGLLCRELGIDPQYVRERVTTVFVDGKCVDDMEGSRLTAGSMLALSSSMPGLAGAAVRRGSPFGRFRGSVTHRGRGADADLPGGIIRVKLFNVLIAELGPAFLARGIVVPRDEALRILEFCGQSSVTVRLADP